MKEVAYLNKNKQKRLDELFEFLRFPSVSADSSYKKDMLDCANWLAGHLNKMGIKSELKQTSGHPIVYGERISDPKKITVLYYGHYDVQPADPLELWHTKPFDPVIRDGKIFGRGTTDDKGQLFTHVKALEAYLATGQELPVNVKLLIEGEEESGAENLENFIKQNQDLLAADIVVVSDASQFGPDLPAITYGLRGIAFVEVKITGPDHDLHSGGFGGSVANPIHMLARIIAALQDDAGRILIDGFHDDVVAVSDWDKKQFARLPFNRKEYLEEVGSKGLYGDPDYSVFEQIWTRPCLDINGISGGYQGEGAKTIIPSWASCKISTRLVPTQDPDDICDKIENFIKKICPDYVDCTIKKYGGANAVEVPTNGPWLKAAEKAIEKGFSVKPLYKKEGGSIPVVGVFKEVLGLDTLLLGWGLDTDNAHSPNECFTLQDFEKGTYSSLYLLQELAKVII